MSANQRVAFCGSTWRFSVPALAKINDLDGDANLIPVCSPAKVNAHEELWTISALAVDGLTVPLRRFRKSHHFVPASPDPGAQDQEASAAAAA